MNQIIMLTFCPVPSGSAIFSGEIFFMTQTAAITSLTPAGGFFIDFTMVISAGCNTRKDILKQENEQKHHGHSSHFHTQIYNEQTKVFIAKQGMHNQSQV
jgi:hypothetical protein